MKPWGSGQHEKGGHQDGEHNDGSQAWPEVGAAAGFVSGSRHAPGGAEQAQDGAGYHEDRSRRAKEPWIEHHRQQR